MDNLTKLIGMVFALIISLLTAFLYRRKLFNGKTALVFLSIATAFGFLFFSPMIPNQFQTIVLGKAQQLGMPLSFAIGASVFFTGISFAFGRVFCGYACPIGALQELLYRLPVKKIETQNKIVPLIARLFSLTAFFVLAFGFSIGMLNYSGIDNFFRLNSSSPYFFVFTTILGVAVFYYRPFCRFLCPYGAVASLISGVSLLKLNRNNQCIDCGLCEKACPTNESGRKDRAMECYLCNRCREVCPKDAITYGRRSK